MFLRMPLNSRSSCFYFASALIADMHLYFHHSAFIKFLFNSSIFFPVLFCLTLGLLLCSSSWPGSHPVSYACFELRILLPQLPNAGISILGLHSVPLLSLLHFFDCSHILNEVILQGSENWFLCG